MVNWLTALNIKEDSNVYDLEPFQRTDIITQPLGPTILEVLNCRFHKIKGEKARYQLEEKNNNTIDQVEDCAI
jgi:hypothetical protein